MLVRPDLPAVIGLSGRWVGQASGELACPLANSTARRREATRRSQVEHDVVMGP
jgi:hypothetical protein